MEENKQVQQEEEAKETKQGKKEDKPIKKVHWDFDSVNSVMYVSEKSKLADIEARFKFKLVIYKDSETHVESMKITNYVIDKQLVVDKKWVDAAGAENGSIVTSIVDLPQDIKKFKQFGVVMGDTYFRDLARRIEQEYADITVSTVTLSDSDDRYKDLIDEIRRYFEEYKEKDYVTGDSCYMPVNMFNGLVYDCGYSEYEMKNLRGQLAQDGYIYHNKESGRYAILKRLSGKPERVIAFKRDKLGVEMSPAKPDKQDKKKVKGDGE